MDKVAVCEDAEAISMPARTSGFLKVCGWGAMAVGVISLFHGALFFAAICLWVGWQAKDGEY